MANAVVQGELDGSAGLRAGELEGPQANQRGQHPGSRGPWLVDRHLQYDQVGRGGREPAFWATKRQSASRSRLRTFAKSSLWHWRVGDIKFCVQPEMEDAIVDAVAMDAAPGVEEAEVAVPSSFAIDIEALPKPLACLRLPNPDAPGAECVFYILGTAHVSRESCNDTARLITAVQPDLVLVELCPERQPILQMEKVKVSTERCCIPEPRVHAGARLRI